MSRKRKLLPHEPVIEFLELDGIDVLDNRRPLSEERVAALMESINTIGRRTPPTVRYEMHPEHDWLLILVSGAHRLEAMKRLGMEDGPFQILPDDVNADLWEIDENLCRHELSAAERAELTARRKAIYEEMHPESAHGSPNVSRQVGDLEKRSEVERFTKETAKVSGRSERNVQRDAERGAKITPEAIKAVQDTPLDKGAFLDKLKSVPPEKQTAMVKESLGKPAGTPAKSSEMSTETESSSCGDPEAEARPIIAALDRISDGARDIVRAHLTGEGAA